MICQARPERQIIYVYADNTFQSKEVRNDRKFRQEFLKFRRYAMGSESHNILKTAFMTIGDPRRFENLSKISEIREENKPVKRVKMIKCPGNIIVQHLTWEEYFKT